MKKDEKNKDCCGVEHVNDGRLRWMCRRGMLELDLLLKNFMNSHYERLDESDKKLFLDLLAEEDTILWDWLVVSAQQPPEKYAHLVQLIRQIK